jgi:hypothetical protein
VSEYARRADGHQEGADHRADFCDARPVLAEPSVKTCSATDKFAAPAKHAPKSS